MVQTSRRPDQIKPSVSDLLTQELSSGNYPVSLRERFSLESLEIPDDVVQFIENLRSRIPTKRSTADEDRKEILGRIRQILELQSNFRIIDQNLVILFNKLIIALTMHAYLHPFSYEEINENCDVENREEATILIGILYALLYLIDDSMGNEVLQDLRTQLVDLKDDSEKKAIQAHIDSLLFLRISLLKVVDGEKAGENENGSNNVERFLPLLLKDVMRGIEEIAKVDGDLGEEWYKNFKQLVADHLTASMSEQESFIDEILTNYYNSGSNDAVIQLLDAYNQKRFAVSGMNLAEWAKQLISGEYLDFDELRNVSTENSTSFTSIFENSFENLAEVVMRIMDLAGYIGGNINDFFSAIKEIIREDSNFNIVAVALMTGRENPIDIAISYVQGQLAELFIMLKKLDSFLTEVENCGEPNPISQKQQEALRQFLKDSFATEPATFNFQMMEGQLRYVVYPNEPVLSEETTFDPRQVMATVGYLLRMWMIG